MIHVDPTDLSGSRPDRCTSEFLRDFPLPESRFGVGDVITFQAADGWEHVITVLGFTTCRNGVLAMHYDGLPHFVAVTASDLDLLRVVRIDVMGASDIAMYREWLGLDPEDDEAGLLPA